MPNQDSLQSCLERVRQGDPQSINEIWRQYYPKLVRLARQHFHHRRSPAGDEEDAALNALHSFFQASKRGRFPDVSNHNRLWKLLAAMTRRKAVDLIRLQMRLKRGGGNVLGESTLGSPKHANCIPGLEQIQARNQTPDQTIMHDEQVNQLLNDLEDGTLRAVGCAILSGESNQAIAQTLGCSICTVERKKSLVRKIWSTKYLQHSA